MLKVAAHAPPFRDTHPPPSWLAAHMDSRTPPSSAPTRRSPAPAATPARCRQTSHAPPAKAGPPRSSRLANRYCSVSVGSSATGCSTAPSPAASGLPLSTIRREVLAAAAHPPAPPAACSGCQSCPRIHPCVTPALVSSCVRFQQIRYRAMGERAAWPPWPPHAASRTQCRIPDESSSAKLWPSSVEFSSLRATRVGAGSCGVVPKTGEPEGSGKVRMPRIAHLAAAFLTLSVAFLAHLGDYGPHDLLSRHHDSGGSRHGLRLPHQRGL